MDFDLLLSNVQRRGFGVIGVFDSDAGVELARKGAATGRCPSNRCRVHVLGDARAGKTSLCKNLMGQEYDANEPTTTGINTRMCQLSTVDEKWQEKKLSWAAEFKEKLTWYICSGIESLCRDRFSGTRNQMKNFRYLVAIILTLVLLLAFWTSLFSLGICFNTYYFSKNAPPWKYRPIVYYLGSFVILWFLFGKKMSMIISSYAIYSIMLLFFSIDLHISTVHLDTSTLMRLAVAIIFIGLMFGVRGPCEDIVGQFYFTMLIFSSLCIIDHIHVCWKVVYKDIHSKVLFLLSSPLFLKHCGIGHLKN